MFPKSENHSSTINKGNSAVSVQKNRSRYRTDKGSDEIRRVQVEVQHCKTMRKKLIITQTDKANGKVTLLHY